MSSDMHLVSIFFGKFRSEILSAWGNTKSLHWKPQHKLGKSWISNFGRVQYFCDGERGKIRQLAGRPDSTHRVSCALCLAKRRILHAYWIGLENFGYIRLRTRRVTQQYVSKQAFGFEAWTGESCIDRTWIGQALKCGFGKTFVRAWYWVNLIVLMVQTLARANDHRVKCSL